VSRECFRVGGFLGQWERRLTRSVAARRSRRPSVTTVIALSWRVRLRSRFRSLNKDGEVLCTRPESDSTRLRSETRDPRPKELIGVGEPRAARPRARPPQRSRRHWFEMQDPNLVQLTRVAHAGPETHSVHVGPEVQNPNPVQLTRVSYAGPVTHSVHVGPGVQNPSVTQ